MVDTCHYTLVPTHRTGIAERDPDVNYGLWGDDDVSV